LCNFLHSPVTSSLLGPNILLRTLFSNTLSLCSSLSVRDQVPHPYKTTGRIMVFLYFNLYIPGQQARWQKTMNRMVANIPRIQSALNLFMNTILICTCCSQIFELCHAFKGAIPYLYALLVTVSL
jgi:hypothetical protein